MKRFMFSAMAIAVITLTGCSKDDDVAIDKNLLIGIWRLAEIDGYTVGSIFEDPELFTAVEIYEDGSYDCFGIFGTVDKEEGTYTIKGKSVTFYYHRDPTFHFHISTIDSSICKGMAEFDDGEWVSVTMQRPN